MYYYGMSVGLHPLKNKFVMLRSKKKKIVYR